MSAQKIPTKDDQVDRAEEDQDEILYRQTQLRIPAVCSMVHESPQSDFPGSSAGDSVNGVCSVLSPVSGTSHMKSLLVDSSSIKSRPKADYLSYADTGLGCVAKGREVIQGPNRHPMFWS